MIESPVDDPSASLARARVRVAESDCYLLYDLLPRPDDWRGVASWAFGLRIEGLRQRIDAAIAALGEAEAAL